MIGHKKSAFSLQQNNTPNWLGYFIRVHLIGKGSERQKSERRKSKKERRKSKKERQKSKNLKRIRTSKIRSLKRASKVDF